LLHFFFLNYSIQDFTVLYASLFFSVLLGMLYDKVKKSGAVPIRVMQLGLVATVLIFIAQYHAMNYFARDDFQSQGQGIAQKSSKDDVIFWPALDIEPQLVFYAQRNIRYAKTMEDAKAFLAQHGLKQGLMFHPNQSGFASEKVVLDTVQTH